MEMNETVQTFYVVYDWMNNLGLTLSQRDVYAVIYGYTVSKKGSFRGSQTYLGERVLCSRTTVNKIIKVLKEKGLIRVRDFVVNNVTYYDYRAVECSLVREAKEKDRLNKLQKDVIFEIELCEDDTTPCSIKTQPLLKTDTPPCADLEHNNKAKSKGEKKAVSLENETEKESEPASFFKNKIKDLFKTGAYPFDSHFENDLKKNLSESGVEESQVESFLDFVQERVKANSNCSSPVGLFRKLALSADVAVDFKQSYKPPKEQAKETCPCCGKKTVIGHESCDHCGLSAAYFRNDLEIFRHRGKMKLESVARERLENEVLNVFIDGGFSGINPMKLREREEKIEQIYKKYGIEYVNEAAA